jgi:hypothetical protein
VKRIIMHWTAGGHKANATDKRHYHFIVDGDGTVVAGNHAPEANEVIRDPMNGSTYAAHTRGLNTGSIGVAVAAMAGATEAPFNAGAAPITERQLTAFCGLVARLAKQYGIAVTERTILTHAEVQPVLGIRQAGKWDITWLPGMDKPSDARGVGAQLRLQINAAMVAASAPAPKPVAANPAPETDSKAGMWGRLIRAIVGIIRGRG